MPSSFGNATLSPQQLSHQRALAPSRFASDCTRQVREDAIVELIPVGRDRAQSNAARGYTLLNCVRGGLCVG
jgi:hypothetical protein